jgi:integrase
MLARNVIALVERPKDADDAAAEDSPGTEPTSKSWTLAELSQFRESVRDHRLFACWPLAGYGLRRSEVLGLRWGAVSTPARYRSGGGGSPWAVRRYRVRPSHAAAAATYRYRRT